jgi:hypothetical protein
MALREYRRAILFEYVNEDGGKNEISALEIEGCGARTIGKLQARGGWRGESVQNETVRREE